VWSFNKLLKNLHVICHHRFVIFRRSQLNSHNHHGVGQITYLDSGTVLLRRGEGGEHERSTRATRHKTSRRHC